jgi:hypothetical protein
MIDYDEYIFSVISFIIMTNLDDISIMVKEKEKDYQHLWSEPH